MTLQKLLKELRKTGMTDAEIGVKIGAPQSTITRLRNGIHKTTSYERGIAINKLFKEKCQTIDLNDEINLELLHHDFFN